MSEEEDMLSQVNPRVPKLSRNAGTDTVSVRVQWYGSVLVSASLTYFCGLIQIGRGWRIRAEATDIFTDEHCGQTNIHKPQ